LSGSALSGSAEPRSASLRDMAFVKRLPRALRAAAVPLYGLGSAMSKAAAYFAGGLGG